MLPDTGIDDVKKQRNAEYAKHINDPVLSSLKMEGILLLFNKSATKRTEYFRGPPTATCISTCCRYSNSHVSQNSNEVASKLRGDITWSALKMVLMRAAHVVMASYGFPGKHLTQGRSAPHCAIRIRRCRCCLYGIPWSL
jgi:hypothetical protein